MFYEISGFSPNEVIGNNPRFLKSGYTTDEDYEDMWETIKGGQSWKGIFKNNKKSGGYYWVRQTMTPVIIDGKISSIVSIQEDVSMERKYEDQKTQLINELEKSNKDLMSFANIISHDLKSHLRVITGLSELLKEDYLEYLESEGLEMFHMIQERISTVNELITGVLQHSLIGRTDELKSKFESKEIIEKVIKHASQLTNDEINFEIVGDLPEILFSKTLFEQVISNLIINAVTHLGKPIGNVKVSCESKESKWQFCVEDDGVGIAANELQYIFQIFTKGTHSDYTKSSGIGLAIVKKIIMTEGGEIWAESEINSGSSFYFTIKKILNEKSITKQS